MGLDVQRTSMVPSVRHADHHRLAGCPPESLGGGHGFAMISGGPLGRPPSAPTAGRRGRQPRDQRSEWTADGLADGR
jgi:hypothetical protein